MIRICKVNKTVLQMLMMIWALQWKVPVTVKNQKNIKQNQRTWWNIFLKKVLYRKFRYTIKWFVSFSVRSSFFSPYISVGEFTEDKEQKLGAQDTDNSLPFQCTSCSSLFCLAHFCLCIINLHPLLEPWRHKSMSVMPYLSLKKVSYPTNQSKYPSSNIQVYLYMSIDYI